MLIAQITDCHIVAPGRHMADRVDPTPSLERVIEAIEHFDRRPDLVVGTGDLVNDGDPDQYDQLQVVLGALSIPFIPLPGNHDDRTELRRRFPQIPDGDRHDPIDHVIETEHDVRLICLDTTIPGRHDGRISEAQCQWLDEQLAQAPDQPTIVFQHHPPFASGIPSMDGAYGLDGIEREAAVVSKHSQVELVSCGHYHRSITRRFAGTVASCWPSTAVQLDLGFDETLPTYRSDPVGFALHHFDGDEGLTSHLVPVTGADAWVPSWAKGD